MQNDHIGHAQGPRDIFKQNGDSLYAAGRGPDSDNRERLWRFIGGNFFLAVFFLAAALFFLAASVVSSVGMYVNWGEQGT
jgi:hypothetical protein